VNEPRPPPTGKSQPRGLAGVVRAYPIITATIVVCTGVGVVAGLLCLPEAWPLWRKLAGGALGGAGCGLIVTAPRILG
jgi:hypothetical protein